MNRKLALAMALLPFGVQAQVVPAIEKTAAVVEAYEVHPQIQLDAKERRALQLANEWKNNPDKPFRGKDGSVQYVYGATLPVLICAALRVCMVRLQEGEMVVGDMQMGDKVRWEPYPVMVGPEGRQTLMIAVKPKDVGLVTNMVVNTNRRSYTILLKSTKDKWMPELSFAYPEDADKAWEEIKKKTNQVAYSSTLSTGQNVANLDFNYRMGGDSPKWRPVRVYSDGTKTYIELPDAAFSDELPALVMMGKGGGVSSDETEQVVNYRLIGNRLVVDKVIDHAALILGVGDRQTKVTIDHIGRKQQ